MENSEKAYNQLKKAILYGQFNPGERLIQLDLVRRFGFSRLHVRDALNKLYSQGLIKMVPNKGATVKKLSVRDVEEDFGILNCLERYGAEFGLTRLKKKDIEELCELNRFMLKDANADDFLGYIRKNTRFHSTLAKRGGNRKLVTLIQNIRERNRFYTVQALIITKHKESLINDHDMIIEACIQKDLVKLKEHITNHINHAKSVIINYISQFS